MYAYCGNNPIMYTDPTGEWILLTSLLLGFFVGTAVSAVSQKSVNDNGNIDWLQATVDGVFTALSVGLAATGIGVGTSMLIGGGLGFAQYGVDTAMSGGQFSWIDATIATGLGTLGGAISGAGAQNAKGLADAILSSTSTIATGMIGSIRSFTGNTAFSNVVTRIFNDAIIKIGATTIGAAFINNIKHFYSVD